MTNAIAGRDLSLSLCRQDTKKKQVYVSLLAHVLSQNLKATEQAATKATPQPAPSEQPHKPEATKT